jgi:hypothetical protein
MVFVAVTDEVVQGARDAVKSAEEIRQRECGAGDPRQRGPNCRQRDRGAGQAGCAGGGPRQQGPDRSRREARPGRRNHARQARQGAAR